MVYTLRKKSDRAHLPPKMLWMNLEIYCQELFIAVWKHNAMFRRTYRAVSG